jgi:hypothetical protein
MIKQILALNFTIFAAITCSNTTGDGLFSEISSELAPTPTSVYIQTIQINQGSVLPPYGMKVKADIASLKISLSSSKDEATGRFEDIQQAIEQISTLANEDEAVDLASTAVNQVTGDSARASASSLTWNVDSTAVTLKLTTSLTDDNSSLLESLVTFNNFLSAITLPDTMTIQAFSIESEIHDPEIYRSQLVAKVYQELEAVQAEYGQAVQFEITGLHSGLKTISLSDTEYYIYLEPAIIVTEF